MTSLNCSEARVEIEHRADPEHLEKSFLRVEFVACRDGSCKLARLYIYPSDKRITIVQLETHREIKSYFQLYQTLRYVVDYMINIDKVLKFDEHETAKLVCLVSLVIGHSCMRYEVALRESAPGGSPLFWSSAHFVPPARSGFMGHCGGVRGRPRLPHIPEGPIKQLLVFNDDSTNQIKGNKTYKNIFKSERQVLLVGGLWLSVLALPRPSCSIYYQRGSNLRCFLNMLKGIEKVFDDYD